MDLTYLGSPTSMYTLQTLKFDEISFIWPKYLSTSSSRSQRHYKSRLLLREISFISQKSLSSRRDLVSISPDIQLSSRPDLRDITDLAEFLTRSFISPRPQRHYKSRRNFVYLVTRYQRHYKSRRVLVEISLISTRSRRDLRDITNLAEISSRLTRSRQDLCHLGEISLISPRSRRDLVYLA